MRVIQILPGIAYGDATGNDALAIRGIIEAMGLETGIYAPVIDRRIPEGLVSGLEKLPSLKDEDVILYHFVTGTELNRRILRFRGKKVLIYHNITPSYFFSGYNDVYLKSTAQAYADIHWLADKADFCVCDSEYNRRQLEDMGFRCRMEVCPILIPFRDYERNPGKTPMERYGGDGKKNILFVGRIAPNKRFEDLLASFAVYHRTYCRDSRLILVGNPLDMEAYDLQLKEYAKRLGIEEDVVFTGHISFADILAYYRLADLFLCMSEHEGFCVPLVEAMFFGIPIVAYASSAVPETLGSGGLLAREKDPALIAGMMDRLLRDESLRKAVSAGQKERLDHFSHESVSRKMMECIRMAAAV